MDVASNDDSLTEIGKYFAILIFADSYWREIPRKLEDRENFRVYGIQMFREDGCLPQEIVLNNIALRKAKTLWSFGLSECKGVN